MLPSFREIIENEDLATNKHVFDRNRADSRAGL